MPEKKTKVPMHYGVLRQGKGDSRPLIGLSLSPSQREAIVDGLLSRGLRPISLQITGEEHMLEMEPKLLIYSGTVGSHFLKKLLRRGVPVLKWSKYMDPDDERVSVFAPDRAAMGALAADHFAERGFKKVAYISWAAMFADEVDAMCEGFASRARDLDMAVHTYKWANDKVGRWWEHYKLHGRAFRAWLDRVGTPLGVFSTDDRLATLMCMYCKDLGLDVPLDVALLGTGDRPDICRTSPVEISHVGMDRTYMVQMLMDLLECLLAGKEKTPQHVLYEPHGIVLAESTDVLASVDRNVAKALRFIWAYYSDNLSVSDIADAVGMPLYELQRAFKKELGRAVGDELRRKRMEVFVRLLLSTDTPIEDLRIQCGYFSSTLLFRTFKRQYGTTPMRYRAMNAKR